MKNSPFYNSAFSFTFILFSFSLDLCHPHTHFLTIFHQHYSLFPSALVAVHSDSHQNFLPNYRQFCSGFPRNQRCYCLRAPNTHMHTRRVANSRPFSQSRQHHHSIHSPMCFLLPSLFAHQTRKLHFFQQPAKTLTRLLNTKAVAGSAASNVSNVYQMVTATNYYVGWQ